MKTQLTNKTASAMFFASLLLSLSGHAGQNFNLTRSFSTDGYNTSDHGSQVTFAVSDNFTTPNLANGYNYNVTAKGIVTGKIPGCTFSAVDGNVTAGITNGNTASYDACLKIFGLTVWQRHEGIGTVYESPHFIKEIKSSGSVPFEIPVGMFPVPCVVDATAKADVDAYIRVSASFSQSNTVLPQVSLSAGPVADIVATADASLEAGTDWASAGPVVTGSVKLGQSSLSAVINLKPTKRYKAVKQGRNTVMQETIGLHADASVLAQQPNVTGDVGIYLEAKIKDIFSLDPDAAKTIRTPTLPIYHYSHPAPAPLVLLGPAPYELF